MMESLILEGQNIIKDITNLFKLEEGTKSIIDGTLTDIKNSF